MPAFGVELMTASLETPLEYNQDQMPLMNQGSL